MWKKSSNSEMAEKKVIKIYLSLLMNMTLLRVSGFSTLFFIVIGRYYRVGSPQA